MSNVCGEWVMKSSVSWTEKNCFMCGKHFQIDDKIVLVVPSGEYKRKYKRLELNAVIHQDEWEELKKEFGSIDKVLEYMGKSTKPRREKLTGQKKEMAEQFIEAAYCYGYRDSKYTKDGAQAKMSGASDLLKYNAYSDRISYSNRRQRGMFDGLFTNQLVANVWNKMHELRGDGKRNNYSADGIINKAIDKTKEIMGDLG